MGRPFFSVVIPTKNRSFLVGLAIQSVLRQSFEEFEIIIADNDDSDATRPVVEAFRDARIRYYRTGGLSMPDNWDFAASQAQGEYLAILEDKQALRKHALERVYREVEGTRYPVVGWLYDRFYDTQQPPRIVAAGGAGNVELIPARRILQLFIEQGRAGKFDRLFPRGLNSCIHRALARRIRSGPAGRLCLPQAPDYTLGFLQLAYCDSVLHIDEALVVVGGYRYSTGRTAKVDRTDVLRYFQGSDVDEAVFYEHVPVKAVTISGSLYNDYETVHALVGGNLADFPLDLQTYFIQCFNDIQVSRKMGADVSAEMAAWERGLSEQEPSLQASVYRALAMEATVSLSSELEALKTSRSEWKNLAKKLQNELRSVQAEYAHLKERYHLLEKRYSYIKRSSPLYWALALTHSPWLAFEDAMEGKPGESPSDGGLDAAPLAAALPAPEMDAPAPYSNALEYILYEETRSARQDE